MSTDTYTILDEAVTPLDTASTRQQYRDRQIPRAEHVKDIDRRYRWDLLWAARNGAMAGPNHLDLFELFSAEGLEDSHIETALKAIVPAL